MDLYRRAGDWEVKRKLEHFVADSGDRYLVLPPGGVDSLVDPSGDLVGDQEVLLQSGSPGARFRLTDPYSGQHSRTLAMRREHAPGLASGEEQG